MGDVAVLGKKREIQLALKKFRAAVRNDCESLGLRQMMFPGGGRADSVEAFGCQTGRGYLVVGFPSDDWRTRVPIFLNLDPPKEKYAPNVEVNIPLAISRSVSGCIVLDRARGAYVIASRGFLTSHKSRIPRDLVLSFFADWLFTARDGDKDSSLIGIGAIESPRLREDLASFVAAVNDFKAKLKSGDLKEKALRQIDHADLDSPRWHHGKEYEGRIESRRSAQRTIYDYSHGPLKNSVADHLRKVFGRQYDVEASVHVDIALVDRNSGKARAIFEVKTASRIEDQIYKGIGQLLVYAKRFGGNNCDRILVVPEEMDASALSILQGVGIQVCRLEGDRLLVGAGSNTEFALSKA